MNIRVKAALLTVGLLAGSGAIFFAIGQVISRLTAEELANAIMIAFMVFTVYMMYSITLSRLEYEAKLKEIRDQK